MFLSKDIFFWEFVVFFWIFFFSLGLSLLLCGVNLIFSLFLLPNRNFEQKLSGYECGFDSFKDDCSTFDVQFYVFSILFMLFDVELIYLFPFSVLLPSVSLSGFWTVEIFMLIIGLGFVFEYSKEALNWQSV